MKARKHIQLDKNSQNNTADIIASIDASNIRLQNLAQTISFDYITRLINSQKAIKSTLENSADIIFAFDNANLLINEQVAESLRLAEELVKLIKIRKIDYNANVEGIVKFNLEQLLLSNQVLINAMTLPDTNATYKGIPREYELQRLVEAETSYNAGHEYIKNNMIPTSDELTFLEDIKVHRKRNIFLAALFIAGITMIAVGSALPPVATLFVTATLLGVVGAGCLVIAIAGKIPGLIDGYKALSTARVTEELKKVPLYNAHTSIFKLKQKTALIADLSLNQMRKT